jgi:hypothetical protein
MQGAGARQAILSAASPSAGRPEAASTGCIRHPNVVTTTHEAVQSAKVVLAILERKHLGHMPSRPTSRIIKLNFGVSYI